MPGKQPVGSAMAQQIEGDARDGGALIFVGPPLAIAVDVIGLENLQLVGDVETVRRIAVTVADYYFARLFIDLRII